MSKLDLSKRYARALFAVSKESGSQAKIYSQLKQVAVLTEQPEVRTFINNPSVSLATKKEVFQKAFHNSQLAAELVSFLDLLLEKKRISAISEIVKTFEEIVDQDNGLTRGFVYSAKPLGPDALTALEGKISNILKKKIVLTSKEDPSLIAGAVAKVGGWTFDDSLQTHLKNLNEELLNH